LKGKGRRVIHIYLELLSKDRSKKWAMLRRKKMAMNENRQILLQETRQKHLPTHVTPILEKTDFQYYSNKNWPW
jgi:hypothetical protein